MPKINELTPVSEQEYSLYVNDDNATTKAYGSDDAYSARFRYATQVKKNPKTNYFGKVELPESKNYITPFFKGAGRAIISAVPTIGRELGRIGTDALAWTADQYYGARGEGVEFQIKQLEKRRGVDKMSIEEKRDFYQNDPEYKALFDKRMGMYDEQTALESKEFDDAVNETYGNMKKATERWVSSFGLDRKENDVGFSYELGSGAASLAGAVAMTFITKNPQAAAVSFGLGQTGSVYEELREKGVEPSKAIMYAVPAGIAEGALEEVGLHLLVDNMAAKTWVRGAIKSFVSEAIQEGSQQSAEEIIMAKFRTDEELEEKLSRVGWSMIYGGILGSGATIAGRPALNRHAGRIKSDLVEKYGVKPEKANELIGRAVYGGAAAQAQASEEIQKIIGKAELQNLGFDEQQAEKLASKMVVSDAKQKEMILQAANAELDPETYEGGSIEAGAKFMDSKLREMDLVAEDFDIKEKVKQTALENGVKEDEAELAGSLTENFARVMTNLTNETPREQWENGGALLVEDARKPDIADLEPVAEEGVRDENGIVHYSDGTYDDGEHIYKADGTILFQSAYAGSRVDYDHPSLEAIGSGEGHQAHGYGLYYALNKDVAEQYRQRFMEANFDYDIIVDGHKLSDHEKAIFRNNVSGNDAWVAANGNPAPLKESIKRFYGGEFEYTHQDLIDLLEGEIKRIEDNPKMSITEFLNGVADQKYRFKSLIESAQKEAKAAGKRNTLENVKQRIEKHLEPFIRGRENEKETYNVLHNIDVDKLQIKKSEGQVHEVDIPESPYLLDEQKPFSEQSDVVKNALHKIVEKGDFKNLERILKLNEKGDMIYESIALDIEQNNELQGRQKKAASELLEKNGVKGITYDGRRDGRCFVIFNPKDVKVIQKFYQGENNPRGYIELTELGNVIHLLKTADASTIVHELGHYFVNRYLGALEKAGKLDEAKGVLDWLGVSSVKELTKEHHEKFARGFETYVMEGEAPNTHMQSLFTRFKNFLIGVYKDLTSGNILKPEEINDDVRSFFDKMLAVDETPDIDIEKIRAKSGALKEIVQNAIKGKEVSVDGLTLEDVNDLLKAVNARLPRKPKNLTQLLRQAGGINLEFARMMDIDKAMGLQDAVGGAQGLFVKNGGIDKEDSLVEFLRQNGFIYGDNQTYEDTSKMWDDAMTAIENADNLYTQEGQEIMDRRESLLEAAKVAQEALGDLDYDAIVKAVKELRKNNIAAVNKDTLKYIKGKLKSIDSDYKKLMGNMLKAQKADFQKMQSDLIDFIKAQPLTGDSKVKLLSAIKKAKSMDIFYRVLNEVNERAKDYYENERCKAVQKQIQKELKGTRPHGAENQKYDYENNKLFDDLRAYNKMTKPEAYGELAKMKEGLTEDKWDDVEEVDKIRMRFLDMKAKGADASFDLLQAVLTDIQKAKALGKSSRDFDEQVKSINRENDRQALLGVLEKSTADRDGLKTKAMNAYRKGFANLYSLLNSMFGKEIADKYQFETEQANVDANIYRATQKSIESARQIFGVKKPHDIVKVFADMVAEKQTLVDMEGVKTEVNHFHIMDIYNAIKNEKTRNDYYQAYGEDTINNLILTLTPQERAYADYLMTTVNGYYDMMNKVYISLYATDLAKVENYWPATSEHKETVDILGDFAQQSSIPSALKERSKGRVIPKPANAMEKFNRHIAEAEYISNLGVPYMEMKRVFKSRRVKSAIQQHFGDGVYNTLLQDIDTVSLRKKIEMIDAVSQTMNKVLSNFVLAKIAIAPSVFFKQLVSTTNYTEQMDAGKWLAGFMEGIAHPKQTWDYMMQHVDYLKSRLAGGHNEALIMALAEKKSDWRNALSVMTRYGDMAAIVFGGYPYLKSMVEAGDAQAVDKFMFATLRSQQSGTKSSLSPFQQSTSAWRVFLAFKNTPTQYMRKIVDAFVMKQNGDISTAQFNKTLFNYAVVQPALLALVSFGYYAAWAGIRGDDRDDDDNLFLDILTEMIINPISAIPILSDVAGAAVSATKGEKNYGMRMILFDDINLAMQKMNKKDKDFFDWATIISPAVEAITSAPSGRVLNFVKKMVD